MPGSGGCATLDHSDSESLDSQTCPSLDTAVSSPEEALVAEYEPMSLISGAGHDALPLAKLTKV